MRFTRRTILSFCAALPFARAFATDTPEAAIAALETRSGGRLGVAALDTGNGRRILNHANERFPMCSTFKLLLASLVLQNVDKGKETLSRPVTYNASLFPDADFYAPVTRAHLGQGSMTVEDLCAAAVQWSDNGAANLLLDSVGDPPAVTAFIRLIGDPETRLDHRETAMNVFTPGDPSDTTTPSAMLGDIDRLLLRNKALSLASRQRITNWMLDCKTAAARIPAGLPAGWRSANKTGTYPKQGSTNDVAIIWPPGRKPILLSIYFTGSKLGNDACEKVIADVAQVVSGAFA